MELAEYLAGGAAGRPDSLSGLNPDFTSALTALFAAAPENVRGGLRINSGFRSPEVQARLYAEAVAKYGSEAAARKWVAPPGKSQHNHGHAVDLGYLSDEAKAWAHANAAAYGLTFPMQHEPWHVELAGARGAPGVATAFTDQRGAAPTGMIGAGQMPLSFGPIGEGPGASALGNIAADYMTRQREQQAARAEADAARRTALFSPTGPAAPQGLASLYG
jgi:hypothetical protein